METAADLAERLTRASRKQYWNVYEEFDWVTALDPDRYAMTPELISIYGTELWDSLSLAQRKRLSLFEVGNLFSLTLQGERPLVAGLADRLYSKRSPGRVTEYLHHFLDEENKHMVMFGMFCDKYLGKVYPEKKIALPREFARGEEEVAFYCKALVVEELGDYYNVVMWHDTEIEPLVSAINRVHHRDEARHLSFGRKHLAELVEEHLVSWEGDTLGEFQGWLAAYVKASWSDFYNPSMYKDAGLSEPYEVRTMALAHPACRAHRERASAKLVNYFLELGLLEIAPEL